MMLQEMAIWSMEEAQMHEYRLPSSYLEETIVRFTDITGNALKQ